MYQYSYGMHEAQQESSKVWLHVPQLQNIGICVMDLQQWLSNLVHYRALKSMGLYTDITKSHIITHKRYSTYSQHNPQNMGHVYLL